MMVHVLVYTETVFIFIFFISLLSRQNQGVRSVDLENKKSKWKRRIISNYIDR